jgi:hypothetical protein
MDQPPQTMPGMLGQQGDDRFRFFDREVEFGLGIICHGRSFACLNTVIH